MKRGRIGLAVAIVVLIALIPLGRWEGHRHARHEVAGIRTVMAAIGPIDQADAYRTAIDTGVTSGLDCLAYKRGSNPFALEFCFTLSGRVVEGYDRRGTSPKIWSIREDPGASSIQLDPKKLLALVHRLQQPA
ncbi:MAG TPA: hypothetical protein VGL84_06560 [Gaiellaceae bacterium]|jgi:hypothetical protein